MPNLKKIALADPTSDLVAFICTMCQRPVRHRGVLQSEAPGTMAYGVKGLCKSDAQPNNLKAVRESAELGDVRIDNTVRGLKRYLQARHERGIKPETPSIVWENPGTVLTGAR